MEATPRPRGDGVTPRRRGDARRGPVPAERAEDEPGASRARSSDLALELYRQQTLLQILTARMRETAAALERRGSFDPARLRRALDAHKRYLLEVHEVDEQRLARAIARGRAAAVAPLLATLREGPVRALEFERAVEARLEDPSPSGARDLARRFAAEAERIDLHQVWEAERIHAHIDRWLARPTQRRLLAEIRRFNAARVDAEIALISWASQLHPSAD